MTDSLRVLVAEYFSNHAASFGLDPNTVSVEYVLNWGGFVNYSCTIRDAQRAYHLKLSTSAEDQAALRRWMTLASLLEAYRAPPILDWIEIGSAAGLLFPQLPGSPPTLNDDVIAELVPVIRRLNADRDVSEALRPSPDVTARAAYMASFHARFTADLRGIRASCPPFVSEDVLQWMEDQVGVMLRLVTVAAAFDEQLTNPVHGDLWLNNILWTNRADWYLVDWDDMRIGDPAADLATLLGPTASDPRPLRMLDRVDDLLTPAERDRVHLLGRATLLDWIIDPLADWIDAGVAPEYSGAVRAEKERVHRQALACYDKLY